MTTRKIDRIVLSTLIAGLLASSSVGAEDSAPVWQYQLGLGGKRPVSTFYLSYRQSDGGYVALTELGSQPELRIPLYSTDPKMPSLASRFSYLMKVADQGEDAGGDGTSVKEAFATMLAAVILIGPPVLSMVKTYKELECIPFCDQSK